MRQFGWQGRSQRRCRPTGPPSTSGACYPDNELFKIHNQPCIVQTTSAFGAPVALFDLSSSSFEWCGSGNELDTSSVPSKSNPSRRPVAVRASPACLMIFDTTWVWPSVKILSQTQRFPAHQAIELNACHGDLSFDVDELCLGRRDRLILWGSRCGSGLDDGQRRRQCSGHRRSSSHGCLFPRCLAKICDTTERLWPESNWKVGAGERGKI